MNDISLFLICFAVVILCNYIYDYYRKKIDEEISDELYSQILTKTITKLENFSKELDRARTTDDLTNIILVTEYPFHTTAEMEIHFPFESIHGYGYSTSMDSKMTLQNDIKMYEKVENKNFERDSKYLKTMVDERLNTLKNALEEIRRKRG